jgi:lipopolysaccharide/colanic/teichoic acid biosynthesis glycosyltransferase
MRRAFDILSAGIGLILLAPLFALIALAVKIEDGGPVFYSQLRVGKDFRKFRFLKFRSMIPGADRLAPLTARADPRRTRMGRFLRKYKLDELPQLINVVKGDMQLVGARPELEPYVERFRLQYALLLQDRPGITDPGTLTYRHEEQLFETEHVEEQYVSKILPHKLELSLEHSRQRSFHSDLSILFRTIFGIFGVPRDSRYLQGAPVSHTQAPIKDLNEL